MRRHASLAVLVVMLPILASCATEGGMYRETDAALAPCVKTDLTEMALTKCLTSAGFRPESIHMRHPKIFAIRCRDYWIPMMSACAMFEGTSTADGRLVSWRLRTGLDGP